MSSSRVDKEQQLAECRTGLSTHRLRREKEARIAGLVE
jgi:hypothetical protein